MHKLIISVIVTAFYIAPTWAGEAEELANIEQRLTGLAPQEQPDVIRPAVVPELYEVIYGTEVFYLSADGRYMLQGSLLDLETGENLTRLTRNGIRKKLLGGMDAAEMIIFAPEKPRHVLTVFTDVDCTYCRKLHAEMAQLNSYGIAIRYMMFPRTGANTPAYQKAISVWCAEDQRAALTAAKAGKSVPQATCNNPVEAQFLIGKRLGVTGTPALLMADGSLVLGYRSAKDIATMLDSMSVAGRF